MARLVVKPISIAQFVGRLETEKGFSFARYGDGTFLCLNGVQGNNCDGVEYTEEHAKQSEASILDSTITHGMGNLALTEGRAEEWLEKEGIDIEWYDCNVMHDASLQGDLYPFIRWLRGRKSIMCGASHLHRLKGFPIAAFVTCHSSAAFDEVDSLEQEIGYWIAKREADTVLLSAGQAASPVLVSRLHRTFPLVTVLDVGSIWDPYVGVLSRKIYRGMGEKKVRELSRLNFKEDIVSWGAT